MESSPPRLTKDQKQKGKAAVDDQQMETMTQAYQNNSIGPQQDVLRSLQAIIDENIALKEQLKLYEERKVDIDLKMDQAEDLKTAAHAEKTAAHEELQTAKAIEKDCIKRLENIQVRQAALDKQEKENIQRSSELGRWEFQLGAMARSNEQRSIPPGYNANFLHPPPSFMPSSSSTVSGGQVDVIKRGLTSAEPSPDNKKKFKDDASPTKNHNNQNNGNTNAQKNHNHHNNNNHHHHHHHNSNKHHHLHQSLKSKNQKDQDTEMGDGDMINPSSYQARNSSNNARNNHDNSKKNITKPQQGEKASSNTSSVTITAASDEDSDLEIIKYIEVQNKPSTSSNNATKAAAKNKTAKTTTKKIDGAIILALRTVGLNLEDPNASAWLFFQEESKPSIYNIQTEVLGMDKTPAGDTARKAKEDTLRWLRKQGYQITDKDTKARFAYKKKEVTGAVKQKKRKLAEKDWSVNSLDGDEDTQARLGLFKPTVEST